MNERPSDQLARKLMGGGELLWRIFVWSLLIGIAVAVVYGVAISR